MQFDLKNKDIYLINFNSIFKIKMPFMLSNKKNNKSLLSIYGGYGYERTIIKEIIRLMNGYYFL